MRYFIFISFLCVTVHLSYSQAKSQLLKIVADDRAEGDCFGWVTSISKDFCVVGTSQKKAKAPTGHRLWEEGGAAYIFKKQVNGSWLQTQMLLPDKPRESDYFGSSVSLYENYLAIGCNVEDTISENSNFFNRMGAVYVYKLNKLGQWKNMQKIVLSDRTNVDNFGDEVWLYKQTLAINATQKIFKDSKFRGAVYIYEQSPNGGWIQKQIIKCPETDVLMFGKSISLSDSVLVVGSVEGKYAFVYKLNKLGQWSLLDKLSASDKSDISFGCSVFVNRNTICIGAQGLFERSDRIADNLDTLEFRKKNLLRAGSVYVYQISDKSTVEFKQRIISNDIKADMHFGMCLSLTDSLLAVRAFGDALNDSTLTNNRFGGAAYIFKRDKHDKWLETKKIVSPIRSVRDKFAFSISAYNKTVIIGSRFDKENAYEKMPLNNAGSAYIYEDK